jgi:hypothetical protein
MDDLDTQQADIQERRRLEAQIAIEDLGWVMGDPQGRRFIARMLDRAGIYLPSFHADALRMAFNEGKRYEGLQLLEQIMGRYPELYARMCKESRE